MLPKGYVIMKRRKKEVSFLRRVGTYLLDLVIFYFSIYIPFMLVYYNSAGILMGGDVSYYQELLNSSFEPVLIVGFYSFFILFFVYLSIFEYSSNATPGMAFLGVEIGPKNISYLQAVVRNLAKSVFLSLLIVDILPLLFGNRQRFSEILSNTYVYYLGDKK